MLYYRYMGESILRKKHIKRDRGYLLTLTGNVLVWLMLVLFFVGLPLYIPSAYQNLALNKYLYLMNVGRFSVIVMGFFAAAYFALWGMTKAEIRAFSPIFRVDIAMAAFILLAFISHLFSEYKKVGNIRAYWFYEGSLWGVDGWYMGFMTFLLYFALYLIVSRFFKYDDRIMIPIFLAAFIVFLWGTLNRFGLKIFKFDGKNPEYISSLGNINWFCGYLCTILPLMIGMYWYRKDVRKILTPVLWLSFLITLINGSDSGLFALFFVFLILFVYSLKKEEQLLSFAKILIVFCAALVPASLANAVYSKTLSFVGNLTAVLLNPFVTLVVVLFVAFLNSYILECVSGERKYSEFMRNRAGKILIIVVAAMILAVIALIVVNTLLFKKLPIIGGMEFFDFTMKWGTKRGATWRTGVKLFLEGDLREKLIGVGPDCFYFKMAEDIEWFARISKLYKGLRLTNAHNSILNMLVNYGILGTAAYGAFICFYLKALIKRVGRDPRLMMFILSTAMYIINNMLSFQQVTGTTFFFLLMGMGCSTIVSVKENENG